MKNIKKLFFALTVILCLQQPCHAGFTDTLSSWGSSALQWIQQNPRITGLFATIFTAQAVYSYKQKTTIQEQVETIRKQNITVQEKINTIEELANTIQNLNNQMPTLNNRILKLNGKLLAANEELEEFRNLEKEIEAYRAEKAADKQKNNPEPAWNGPGGFFLTDEQIAAERKIEEDRKAIAERNKLLPAPTYDEQFKERYRKFTDNLPGPLKGLAPALPW
jgi:DNA repair exonuclease SbcCD ATPase subunit